MMLWKDHVPNRIVLITGGSGFIGTHYIDHLRSLSNIQITNVDVAPPKKSEHSIYWKECSIFDEAKLQTIFQEVQPTDLVHLAARTDMAGNNLEDYAVNSVGTEIVARLISSATSIRRAVFTSTQYVVGPGKLPSHDEDFRPHTIYGQSKVLSEKAVRSAGLQCCWTIIRPTNIWGSWHPRYPAEFWRVLKQGRYIHPGYQPVIRCYGYVGNVVLQIEEILHSDQDKVDGRVLYVGDPSINLLDWVNAFSLELTRQKARVVPRWLVRTLAFVGDAVVLVGGRFPIFSSRYHSMTETYDTPMERTFEILGAPKTPLKDGIAETVAWLRTQNQFWKS